MINIPDYTLEICIDFGYKRLNKKIKKGNKRAEISKGEIEVKILIEETEPESSSRVLKYPNKSTSFYVPDEDDDEDEESPSRYYDYEDDEDHFYNKKPSEPTTHDDPDS